MASMLSCWHPPTPAAEQPSKKILSFKNKCREGITWADPTDRNRLGGNSREEVLGEREILSQSQEG